MLVARLGRTITHAEEDTVALATRSGKEAVDPIGLLDSWRQRARAIGFDVNMCFDVPDRVLVHDKLPTDRVTRLLADLADPTVGVCAQNTTFDRGDVIRAVVDWAITDEHGIVRKVLVPPDEVERLADRFCASDRVVQLDPARVGGVIRRRDGTTVDDGQAEPVYTTVELLEVEAAIVAAHERGRHAGVGVVPADLLDSALASDRRLSDEQIGLVRAWCTSGHRAHTAIGRAGTGKTTTMRVAAVAWRAAGYRVIGAAVKGEAARQLAADAGIEADTVALLLTRAAAGEPVLDRRTVLIVDEASTLGDRDLAAILHAAETTGAVVRLIGDPVQHGPVPAGGSFTQLATIRDTPQLTRVRRLEDPGERQRAELVRAGRIDQALDQLQTSGQLTLTDRDTDTYAAMLTRWYHHRQHGEPHPMVHGRNRERRLLNQAAQAILAADGTIAVDQAVITHDGRRLCVGDEVIARHGDRRIHPTNKPAAWLRNGTTGRVVAIHHGQQPGDDDQVIVATDDGLLTCPRTAFDRRRGGLDLGYAVTSYAVQGSTRQVSTSAVTATTARSELYVDITRGRTSNQLYATRTTTPHDDETHLPRLHPDLLAVLHGRLARGLGRTALATDPDALSIARLRQGRNLAGLIAAHRRGEPGPIGAAITRATNAIRQLARTHPPTGLRAMLPPRPASPHLAARWDNLAGDIAVHHALAPPALRRAPAHDALQRALGPRPAQDSKRWDHLADRLIALAVEICRWHLEHRGDPQPRQIARWRPGWLTRHLTNLARAGLLADVDHDRLGRLVVEIHQWRHTHNLIGRDDVGVLGQPPTNPAERWRYQQLARRLTVRDTTAGRGIA